MTEREQTIKALEICASGTNSCNKCPMKDRCKGVSNAAMVAAIKLLKEQEPHVLALEEALDLQNRTSYPCIFVEIRGRDDVFLATINDELYGGYRSEDFNVYRPWACASRAYHKTEYGQSIRFWNLFPTDEYRRAAKWDG